MASRIATTRVRLLLVITAALALGYGASRAPEALARVEWFRVRGVELSGERYLSEDEARRLVGVPPGASVWDDASRWVSRLAGHPLVRSARVRRRFPSTLVFEVEERAPVGLLAAPILEPVDERGHRLPIDPAAHRLDLPLLRIAGDGEPFASPERVERLASGAARIAGLDPAFSRGLLEVTLTRRDDLLVSWGDPTVEFLMAADVPAPRLRDGMRALRDAAARGDGEPVEVDLRFEDQIVVRVH